MKTQVPQRRLQALRNALTGGEGPVLAVVHNYPDPDALAAALGLQALLAAWGLRTQIAYGGGLGRAENKAMIGLLDIDVKRFDELDTGRFRGAVLADTQPGTGNNALPEDIPVLAVFDHHTEGKAVSQVPFHDVRADVGSTSTMVLQYLERAETALDARLATALFVGIKTDTEGLERDAQEADVEAYVRLLPIVDFELVNKISRPPLTEEYFGMLATTLTSAYRCDEAVVANLGEVPVPDLLSAMSDLLVQAKEASWALVVGWQPKAVYFSLRLQPPRKNAPALVGRMIPSEGRGGGHGQAGGGLIATPEGGESEAVEELISNFFRVVNVEDRPPRPLLQRPPA